MKTLTKRQANAKNFKGRGLRASTDPDLVKERFRDIECKAQKYDINQDIVLVSVPRGRHGCSDAILFDREALLVV